MSSPVVSAREAEVLALLGEHLSNAEISARLFISVRTVESHVSALLRKLDEPDRRALSRRAADLARAARPRPAAVLPAPLTAFIGRVRERAELAEAVKTRRLVTAVGPGGVGKTRLALAVAADAAGDFADGVWFVDLAPVTDPARVGAAVAVAVGVGEQPGRGAEESVLAALADREVLLVLDNCEQIRDGVAPFLERLLVACPRLRVLATSRARMMVPFEWVFPVPPLSSDGGPDSEAVTLFLERAAAVGRPPEPALRDKIAAICERLDGMALAIELAAARWPTLGLDGLTAGLSDQLRILAGGPRADDRHRSVRAALDWSHDLLEPPDRALLRRISVFVMPFTAEAAGVVAGFAPLEPTAVADGLGRLAEQSLLTATPTATGTRYQALETIRQYGTERLAGADELTDVRSRHVAWCLAGATALSGAEGPDWRARFDAVADDLRASLAWAAARPDHRTVAHRLALALAGLAFTRNLLGESQQRYEQAAALADDGAGRGDTRGVAAAEGRAVADAADAVGDEAGAGRGAGRGADGAAAAAEALREAAGVAGCRRLGDDMYRLHRAAAEAARRAGDPTGAARDLAAAATVAYRFSSEFAHLPTPAEVTGLLTTARRLSGAVDPVPHPSTSPPPDPAADPTVEVEVEADAVAALALAEAAVVMDAFGAVQGDVDNSAGETVACAERAVRLARRAGDPVAESAALDALSGARTWAGDPFGAAAAARRRIEVLAPVPHTPAGTQERMDALAMAAGTALGVGELAQARRWGRHLADHPLLAEVEHHASSWLLVADAFAGNGRDVLTGSERFLDAWRRSGRQRSFSLGPAAASVAMIHGLRGDHGARASWLAVVKEAGTASEHHHGYGAVFDAMVLLQDGDPDAALARVAPEPDQVWKWVSWIWHHWYVGLRVEASVLVGHPEARARVAAARHLVAGNPVATAQLDRAQALLDGDLSGQLAAATAFDAAGCPYQSARTLLLAGGDHTATGRAALAALGLAPGS
ncbi:LuxR C-terminal-related transcriptional regulator [Streptomyces sp. DSM 3412]|uniref:LuxR C-terminal-related transcriptional regulator n=1 Tax=Streptomyces gottesmaniae TaxID=3075518 RepID=A0ABU2YNW7_9ACTN|nr:LuxR C-terminal-related transcriptional regulator [Streptomyces sp. DSM 3412]MDT0566020.1 LuxR C-terminal-related transcriptional regulator [Streptomyces sp. DSM 3412]